MFDPDVLTVGFARRVPSYKRLTLMLRDPKRLRALLLHPERPIQIVVAGKSHPADDGGKSLIQQLVRFADDPEVRHRIVFLPDYDIGMAHYLYWGCDVWLNNPLRPLEACGTSGMKAALNGGLNLSIRDGWWDEMYDGENGWAIPSASGVDDDRRDDIEAAGFYNLVETQVAPRFYDRRGQPPARWVEMVRHTLKGLGPQVLATRMVRDYVTELYTPAAASSRTVSADGYAAAKQLATWRIKVLGAWPAVTVRHVESTGVGDTPELGATLALRAEIDLAGLSPDDVDVQAAYGRVDETNGLHDVQTAAAGVRRGRRRAGPVGGHGAAGAHRRLRLHGPGAAEEQPAGDRGRARRRHRRELTAHRCAPGRSRPPRCRLCSRRRRPGYGLVRDRSSRNHRRFPRGVVRALSRRARSSASTCPSRPPCSARATTRSPRTWPGAARTAPSPAPFIRMVPGVPGTDRWHATVVPTDEGAWTFAVEAWGDPVATWRHKVEVKIDAGQGPEDLANDLEDGARLMLRALRNVPAERRGVLEAAAEALRDSRRDLAHRVGPALDRRGDRAAGGAPGARAADPLAPLHGLGGPEARAVLGLVRALPALRGRGEPAGRHPGPARHVQGRGPPAAADRRRWASTSSTCRRSTRSARSTARAANNTLMPGPEDVGSPWAIGSDEGGHDAIHPQLGTFEDFDDFVAATREQGMEVALDLALQAAPDHPWVTEHPEWFTTRPDGSIAYAENPPKKYQDIYPLNFDNDPKGIYAEMLRIVRLWVDHGVKIFRVDNPHTKPLNFWHWLIWEVKKTDPDVLFLAEAFTRPAMMHALGPDRLHPVVHVLHLADREVGAARSTAGSWSPRPTTCGPTSSSTRRTSCTPACSTAARRCSGSGPCWPPC